MNVQVTELNGGIEILASDDFQAIPIEVTETALVKAGTPLTKAGKKALAGTGAAGYLRYDVDPTINPNGALVVDGIVDYAKAKTNAGITASLADLQAAIPNVILRDNTGVNA